MTFSYHLTGCPLDSFQEAIPKNFNIVFMANDLLNKNLNIASTEMACKSVLRVHYHHNHFLRL